MTHQEEPASKLRLYIWVDPYDVNYGSSLLVAVAANEEGAKKIAAAGKSYSYGKHENKGGQDDLERIAVGLCPADRVLDLPCAEWHDWSE